MAIRNAHALWLYWKHPHLAQAERQALSLPAGLGWLGAMLALSMLGLGIGRLAIHLLGHAPPVDVGIRRLIMHPSWGVAWLLTIGPVLEELSFRAFMTRETRVMSLGTGFSLAMVGFTTLGMAMHRLPHHRTVIDSASLLGLAMLLAVALLLAGLAYLMRRRLQPGLIAMAPAMIVLATLAFAALHVLNFEIGFKPWLLWLTLPQGLVALVLVYVRVQHGLRWSIAMHLAFDWLLIGSAWLAYGARTTGVPGQAALTLMVPVLIGLFVYGIVFLCRHGQASAASWTA